MLQLRAAHIRLSGRCALCPAGASARRCQPRMLCARVPSRQSCCCTMTRCPSCLLWTAPVCSQHLNPALCGQAAEQQDWSSSGSCAAVRPVEFAITRCKGMLLAYASTIVTNQQLSGHKQLAKTPSCEPPSPPLNCTCSRPPGAHARTHTHMHTHTPVGACPCLLTWSCGCRWAVQAECRAWKCATASNEQLPDTRPPAGGHGCVVWTKQCPSGSVYVSPLPTHA